MMRNKLLITIVMMSSMPLFAAAPAPAAKKQKGELGQAVLAQVSKEEFIQAIKDGDEDTVNQYLTFNDDVNWRDGANLTPLMHAAMGKSLPIFTAILAKTKKEDVDARGNRERTALLWAATNSSRWTSHFVKSLMAKGARLDSRDNTSMNALMIAVWARNTAMVEYLLKKFPADSVDNQGNTPLFYAIGSITLSADEQQKQASYDIAKLLLNNGAHIEHRNLRGYSPLLHDMKLINPVNTEAVIFLLDSGADINGQIGLIPGHPERQRWTPLMMAIVERSRLNAPADATPQAQVRAEKLNQERNNKFMNIIRLLVDRGADLGLVTVAPGDVATPLMVAAGFGDFQVVKYLVEHGVDIAIKDNGGETALDYAKSGLDDVEANPAKKSQYQLIIQYLSNPLTHARRVMVSDAIKEGQDRQSQATEEDLQEISSIIDQYLSVPTVAAASSSSAPAAAASSSSAAASTPLMIAASLGDFQMVKYLVESGVDITIKDNLGRTALDVAKGALGVEVNPIKKSQYQLIVKYLSNPVTHTCHVIAQRQLEETFKMPTVLRDIIGEYLTGPTEDKRIINEINTALATKDLSGLAKLLDQNPDAACVADEEKNTPLVLAVRDNYQEAIPLIIQHLKNYRDKQLKDFDKQLTDIEKQEREANESIRKHEKILDALALQIPTAMLESEKNDAQAAYDSELAQDKQKREEYIEKSRKLSLEQERINREVSEVRRTYNTELDKAKELATRLGYQDILELLQAYSPSQGQQATASSSSAAASSSSSSVAPMEQGD